MRVVLATSNVLARGRPDVQGPSRETSSVEIIKSLQGTFRLSEQATENGDNNNNNSDSTAATTAANVDSHPAPYDGKSDPWTCVVPSHWDGRSLYIPGNLIAGQGLSENREEFDITMKIFFLPGWEDEKITREDADRTVADAVSLVQRELRVEDVDLVVLSFAGVSFDADDEGSDDEVESEESDENKGIKEQESESPLLDRSFPKYWAALERLHTAGEVKKLGIADFGACRLSTFMARFGSSESGGHTAGSDPNFVAQLKVPPSVNQLNVRECCVVPKRLLDLAQKSHIELLTHNDSTNIMPLGNLEPLLGIHTGCGNSNGCDGNDNDNDTEMMDFQVSIATPANCDKFVPPPSSSSLSQVPGRSTGSEPAAFDSQSREEEEANEVVGAAKTERGVLRFRSPLVPRFVVKYTVVLKNQGVLEAKGYFVVADVEGGEERE